MPADHFGRFFPAICAGLGLFLAGGVNLLLVGRGLRVRIPATLAVLGMAVAAADALDKPGTAAATARLLAFALIPFLLLTSRRVVGGVAAAVRSLHRPSIRFGLLTTAGVGLAVGSVVVFERAEEADGTTWMAELELLQSRPQFTPTTRLQATTDKGNAVVLREPVAPRESTVLSEPEERVLHSTHLDEQVIRRGAADDRSNCHGWVFTGGRFLLSAEDVELILAENGYQEVRAPQPGDVVIYRSGGVVAHTAVVRYVTEGQPMLVEGKWGSLGVFLHPADKSPYGTDYAVYRTARSTHLLVGLGGRPAPPSAQPPAMATE